MTDRVTANLPSSNFDRTAEFYGKLGFAVGFRGNDWMILSRGPLEIEFFAHGINPQENSFSACIRVDDLDHLYAEFARAGISRTCGTFPSMSGIEDWGMRIFTVIDPDGCLLRCIDNKSTG